MEEPSYYGVCPREHFVQSLDIAASLARCARCDREYRIEDERQV